MSKNFSLIFLVFLIIGCSTTKLSQEQVEDIQNIEEFDQAVKIEKFVPPPASAPDSETTSKTGTIESSSGKKSANLSKADKKKTSSKGAKAEPVKPLSEVKIEKHLPELEDGEGFNGRRPLHDPFRVGQRAVMSARFTGISAGTVELRVNPMVLINGEKAYHFSTHAKTNSFFSFFYKVNDWADTYVRYRDLVPLSFELHVRESKQFREAKTFFDWNTGRARFWEKGVRSGRTIDRKSEWEILPFSQNVISSFFYVRLFKLRVGKKIAFRVADNGKNLIVRADVVRREEISTGAGDFNAHVLKLQFEYNGVFEQKGDVHVWIIDDPDQHLARVEAKIKLGTVALHLEELH